MKAFAVIGGDERQARLARLLIQDGHTVYIRGHGPNAAGSLEDAAARANVIIWPLPLADRNGMLNAAGESRPPDAVLDMMRADQLAVGGRIPLSLMEQARGAGLKLVDYTTREDFAIANAVPSAEGAVQLAMEHTERTIHGSNCLVIGFGRIGAVLARLMAALGADVTVSARRAEHFRWCGVYGYRKADTRALDGALGGFDIVFNTVPHLVLGDALLAQLKPGALVIDLASSPGGVDFAAAKKRGVNCHWALSLPGRAAPESAAHILRDTVYQIIKEDAGL